MAGFGDDVSMSDFRQAQPGVPGEEREQIAGRVDEGCLSPGRHTSDASVLNVPPHEEQSFSGGGGFSGGVPPPQREVCAV